MHNDIGFRRFVTFSDAVAAIAITLLVLPLVDAANKIGDASLHTFFDDNKNGLLAFALSFAVIGSFWWGQHQLLRGVEEYNGVLVAGMFLWLAAIVFLPLPTELIGAGQLSTRSIHVLYVATMLVAAFAELVQQWATVHWPELRRDPDVDGVTIDSTLITTVLMAVVLIVCITAPSIGLWSLLLLLAVRPLHRLGAWRRKKRAAHVA